MMKTKLMEVTKGLAGDRCGDHVHFQRSVRLILHVKGHFNEGGRALWLLCHWLLAFWAELLVEVTFCFLWQLVLLCFFFLLQCPPSSKISTFSEGWCSSHFSFIGIWGRGSPLDPSTYLFLDPVELVNRVLVFGRRDAQQRGHLLPKVVTHWKAQTGRHTWRNPSARRGCAVSGQFNPRHGAQWVHLQQSRENGIPECVTENLISKIKAIIPGELVHV